MSGMKNPISFRSSLAVFLGFAMSSASADQVTLRNGDILNGKVLAMTTNTLTLQDESLGTLILSRARVSNITLGTAAVALPPLASPQMNSVLPNTGQTSSRASSASDPELTAMLHEIREHSNLVQEVEVHVLGSSASPAAMNKFNEILDELSSGQMDINGLRSEAQSAADQLQEYKKEMGPDAGEEVNAYLSILNGFLRETAPTNSAAP
jgi:hypothetical protein